MATVRTFRPAEQLEIGKAICCNKIISATGTFQQAVVTIMPVAIASTPPSFIHLVVRNRMTL